MTIPAMATSPDELWMRQDGPRYTSELRFRMTVDGAPTQPSVLLGLLGSEYVK